jgi:peptidoglycan/LPS O-acetylase OafA/YrhL
MADHQRARLDSLTEARFFAALGVVLLHASIGFGTTRTWLGSFSAFGFIGVSFFFMLSGFVLTWAARDSDAPGQFYKRRFARIYPIYVITWLAAVLYAAVGAGTVSWRPVLLGATLLQAWNPNYDMAYNFPAWSLSVEAFFYAMFPFLIKAVSRMSAARAAHGVAVGFLWMVTWTVVTRLINAGPLDWLLISLPLYRLGEFVCGMCLAAALIQGWRPRIPSVIPILVLTACAFGFWQLRAAGPSWEPDRDIITLSVVPVELMLIASLAGRDLRPHRRRSFLLVELGNASYALYISHALIIFAWGACGLPFDTHYMLVYVVVCIAASLLLHRLVEKPTERWLQQRWRLRPKSETKSIS